MSDSEAELATVAGDVDEPNTPSEPDAHAHVLDRGELVGRYVVLERLGVGGMGEVYAAYDPELDRKIAIKLLLPRRGDAVETSSGHGRLLREAQAMAKLRHPNVVAVHDVGTLGERVFVAMEFVDGGNLSDWMAESHPWTEVLARFLAAGEGLAAAHAAGLIHRDFKPANVLVGRDGTIRVADFGLARATDAERSTNDTVPTPVIEQASASNVDDATLPALDYSLGSDKSIKSLSVRMTVTGATLGTPAYMAPEQYSHTEIDARADQFSFCVALWEALYGQRPFAGDHLHAIMFAIHQRKVREPPAGNDVPATIRRALLRGLDVDPQRRWPDMRTLLTELRFDPKLRRRNLQMTGLGVALLAALTWAVIATRPSPNEPEPVCTGAAAALGDALSPARHDAVVARFNALDHDWARDQAERLPKRLAQWTTDWQAAWTDACEATHVRGEQSTELLDRRLQCLERQRRGFIKLVDALAQADDKLARKADEALAELGSLAACSDSESLLRIIKLPDDPERVRAIDTAEDVLADVNGMYIGGQMQQAKDLLETQAQVVAQLDYAPLSAHYEQLFGRIHMDLDDVPAAETALERAFGLALEAGDDRRAAQVARSLGHELQALDRTTESARWLMIASALADRLDDDVLRGQIEIARTQLLAAAGDYPGSEQAARRAYELLRDAGAKPELLGDALYLMGVAANRDGRYEETIERLEQARAAWSSAIGPRHPRTVASLGLLGITMRATGDYAAAERYFREALAIDIDTYGPDHIQATTHMSNLAVVLSDLNRTDEAIELLQRVLEIRRATPDASKAWTGRTLINLASMQQQVGRYDDAMANLAEGEALLTEAIGPEHPDMMVLHSIRAQVEYEQGNYDAAERSIMRSLQLGEATRGADSPVLYELWTQAAVIALARGQTKLAAQRLRGTPPDDINPKDLGKRELITAKIRDALGDKLAAIAAAEQARAAFEKDGPGSAKQLAEVQAWLRAHESK